MGAENLEDRVRDALSGVQNVEEKKMFGRVVFMVDGKMCVTAREDRIMCRVDPALHDELAKGKGVEAVKMRGKEYKGYLRIDEKVLRTLRALDSWLKLALDFNHRTKSSDKKRTPARRKTP